jgi:hypothetical protein
MNLIEALETVLHEYRIDDPLLDQARVFTTVRVLSELVGVDQSGTMVERKWGNSALISREYLGAAAVPVMAFHRKKTVELIADSLNGVLRSGLHSLWRPFDKPEESEWDRDVRPHAVSQKSDREFLFRCRRLAIRNRKSGEILWSELADWAK